MSVVVNVNLRLYCFSSNLCLSFKTRYDTKVKFRSLVVGVCPHPIPLGSYFEIFLIEQQYPWLLKHITINRLIFASVK